LATLLAALLWVFPATADEVLRPSDLNKNPEKYDRQKVVVEGILLLKLPRNSHLRAIYDSKSRRIRVAIKSKLGLLGEDYVDKGCVSIDNPEIVWKNIQNPRYKRVRIKG
jgi:hypothetical protein